MNRLHLAVAIPCFLASIQTARAEPAQWEVELVQAALNSSGYDAGAADGKMGDKTRDAIKQYQSDWQLPETGELTPEMVDRITGNHPATSGQLKAASNKPDCEVHTWPAPREAIEIEGTCVDGKLSGSGKVTYRSFKQGRWRTVIAEGDYKAGKLHGHGKITGPDGAVFEGEFYNGEEWQPAPAGTSTGHDEEEE